MAFRLQYCTGMPVALDEPGTEVLKKHDTPPEVIEWYERILTIIALKSAVFWTAGGTDFYVEELNRWAKDFYMTVPNHAVSELKEFCWLLTRVFEPAHLRYSEDERADAYRCISDFTWQSPANVPRVIIGAL